MHNDRVSGNNNNNNGKSKNFQLNVNKDVEIICDLTERTIIIFDSNK